MKDLVWREIKKIRSVIATEARLVNKKILIKIFLVFNVMAKS